MDYRYQDWRFWPVVHLTYQHVLAHCWSVPRGSTIMGVTEPCVDSGT